MYESGGMIILSNYCWHRYLKSHVLTKKKQYKFTNAVFSNKSYHFFYTDIKCITFTIHQPKLYRINSKIACKSAMFHSWETSLCNSGFHLVLNLIGNQPIYVHYICAFVPIVLLKDIRTVFNGLYFWTWKVSFFKYLIEKQASVIPIISIVCIFWN